MKLFHFRWILIFICTNITSITSSKVEVKLFSKYSDQKDYFGHATAAVNNWIFVGAYSATVNVPYAGAVYSFYRNSTTLQFVEGPIITAFQEHPHASFGGIGYFN